MRDRVIVLWLKALLFLIVAACITLQVVSMNQSFSNSVMGLILTSTSQPNFTKSQFTNLKKAIHGMMKWLRAEDSENNLV